MSSTAVEVIDLLSDDEDAVCDKKRAAPSSNERRIKAKHAHGGENVLNNRAASDVNDDDDDDEVQVVDGIDSSQAQLKNAAASCSNNDDDICLLGSTGHNALEDFPHSRESCVKHPFQKDPFLYCGQCFCFVCDVLASSCSSWRQHCHATYGQAKWRKMREQAKPKPSGGTQSQVAAPSAVVLGRPRPQAAAFAQSARNRASRVAQRLPVQQLRELQASVETLNQLLRQQEQLHRQRRPTTHRTSRMSTSRAAPARQPSTAPHPSSRQSTNDNSTIYLNMSSSEEQRSFGYACTPSDALDPFMNGGNVNDVQQSLMFRPTQISSIAKTKLNVLCAHLNALRRKQPSTTKAIVYTHYEPMQDACVGALCRLGYSVFDFIGARDPNFTIRKFQQEAPRGKPAVCVILLQDAHVEMALSSATHVFLMEPCLDPAIELRVKQVHRQGRPLQFKRFVFRYSVESNIVELHKEIAAGRISLPEPKFLPPRAIEILVKGIHRTNAAGASSTAPVLLEV